MDLHQAEKFLSQIGPLGLPNWAVGAAIVLFALTGFVNSLTAFVKAMGKLISQAGKVIGTVLVEFGKCYERVSKCRLEHRRFDQLREQRAKETIALLDGGTKGSARAVKPRTGSKG